MTMAWVQNSPDSAQCSGVRRLVLLLEFDSLHMLHVIVDHLETEYNKSVRKLNI